MGRRSSDSEEESRSHRKKKHRRRSSSSSSSGSRVSSRKKSGRKTKSRSRSRDKRRRRRSSSSSSYESRKKRNSRSRSPDRSKFYKSRRSSSRSRNRRSRSRHRRSKSRSSGRSSRKRSRSHSKTREGSRRKNRDKDKGRDRDRGKEKEARHDKQGDVGNIKAGLEHLTPAEQVKARLQLVLQAAEETSLADQVKRIKDIEAIESDSFVAQAFKSNRESKKVVESLETRQDPDSVDLPRLECDKDDIGNIPTIIHYQESDSLAHPSLLIDKTDAEEMWLHRLMTLRQERLMGSPVP
ncbi:serine/Arginine-related protein 53 isoform X2 [Amia ocellicauda]|uniref:serine/Arginine-related protein 53 isoform X2 n=1 Tax=Amia ocellicauda TaxID=2972642 RepID=UPI00346472CF